MIAADDRETPPGLFANLDVEFGFTVDAAASEHNAKCARYWTAADNGLLESWAGEVVWVNPPYSSLEPWVRKDHRSRDATVVMLLPANRTEQRWWQRWVEPDRDLGGRLSTRFLPGRLTFRAPPGAPAYAAGRGPSATPTFGCVVLIWRAT